MADQQGQQGVHFDVNTMQIFQAFQLFMQQQEAVDRREVSTTNALHSIVNKMDQFKGKHVFKYLCQYEKDMELNTVPAATADTLASFELVVVPEIRAHIGEIRGDHGDDWGAFSKALKQEYFMEDSECITKRTFLEWVARPKDGLSPMELLREFERHYAQLSTTEQVTLDAEKIELFLQATSSEIQKKLELLLDLLYQLLRKNQKFEWKDAHTQAMRKLKKSFQYEILNEVAGHEKYLVCDGYSSYFQIRIAEEDQKKTTFITPWGCYAFRVAPFGLTNAPATFQRFMNHVFQAFFGKSIRVYIDDFYIYSSKALHVQKVEGGLQRLNGFGGQLNPDKCLMGEDEVILLGHKISQRGIEVDPAKAKALLELPFPKSIKEVMSFMQKVKYMARSYLLSKPFVILTFENLLPWVSSQMTMSPMISIWLMELQSYEYTFKVENSVRAQLVGILTYQLHEKVIKVPNVRPLPPPPPKVLSNAYTLFFDGAFRRATGNIGGGLVLVIPEGEVVMKEQVTLDGSTSNNEAEYDVLISGLKICLA
ncbi:hypothetical protein L7F22_041219 [Adiantum nelumboides]|nr:hypothetical protein [Adiantum nelumboides]MCO5587272.1 hypothetical protein [Adiantum nelumboides]